MGQRDEEPTIENVDEWVEERSRHQASQLEAEMPLARVARDLYTIYEEERRLNAIWERVNSRVPGMHADHARKEGDEQPWLRPLQAHEGVGSFNSTPQGFRKRLRPTRRWRNFGANVAVAIVLLAILAWPVFSLIAGSMHTASHIARPQSRPTASGLITKTYTGSSFTIQYPASWAISGTKTDSAGLQTVRFHPIATISAEITVTALPASTLSGEQLVHTDPDVQRGTLINTSSATHHGIPWVMGLVNLTSSTQILLGKLEVAYSNQQTPYKIEFGAPPDLFAKYSAVFDSMVSSFYPQAQVTGTTTVTPPVITPSPTKTVSGMQEYSNQYFKIQYPANWIITSITTGGGYLQSVQFRPSAQSAVFVNVNAMHSSLLSGYLLLQLDPDVGLGALLSTNTVTYHGISWATDTVNIAGDAHTPASQVEIAYSNQQAPYRIEFSAPPDQFATYATTFNTIFASFYPVN